MYKLSQLKDNALLKQHLLAKCLLGVVVFTLAHDRLAAQPENPNFSLTTSTYFEIDMKTIALVDIETYGVQTDFVLAIPAPTEAGNPSRQSRWLQILTIGSTILVPYRLLPVAILK
ncbi:MAG: hypothetical protein U5L96_07975 [Owenweeksia sp.]|nr:hypothetical protein [Owenweeksia sp.]